MTTPSPTAWPALRAADAPALIRWLVDVLGFTETLVVRDGDLVAHAELAWPPGGGVMLGSVRDGSAAVTGPSSTHATHSAAPGNPSSAARPRTTLWTSMSTLVIG